MRGKRVFALALCVVMVLGMLPVVAQAADPSFSSTGVSMEGLNLPEKHVKVDFVIENSSGFAMDNIYVKPDLVNSIFKSIYNQPAFPLGPIADGARLSESIIFVLKDGLTKNDLIDVLIPVEYRINGQNKVDTMKVRIFTTSGIDASSGGNSSGGNTGGTSDPVDTDTPKTPEGLKSILMIAPLDPSGQQVPTPTGNYGDRVTVRVPIFNRGGSGAYATRILVTPVLSATLDSFPFDIEAVDYTRGLENMRPGETKEVQYNLRISKEATKGVKEVKFNAVYLNNSSGNYETAEFSVFVNVVKGKEPPKTGAEGEEITTTPKVIIEGYSTVPEKAEDGETLYAGEQFALTMKFRNTASETVQNVQITFNNEAGMILPANNGSNTIYIDRIGAGEMVERTVQMQAVPETEAKSHKIAVKLNYESGKTLKAYEVPADISLSIKQRIRMRIDDPVLEPEVMAGSALYVYFNIYNMGNSTVRNLMVSVEGEGMRMEETYYGGNMSSGASNTADFGIICETAGEQKGKIIISYEDAMGEIYKEEKPFTVNVMDMGGGPGDMMIDPETGMPIDPNTGMPIDMGGEMPGMIGPGGTGLPWWAVTLIVVASLGILAGGLLFFRKRRRKKIIEDK